LSADDPRDPASKVRDWQSAHEWRGAVGGRVVFTNGVFDLLHPGHIDVLMGARREGHALIVGLNSDGSVQRLKGPERPVRSQAERAYVLAALEAVDCVVVFDEDTPLELVRFLRPDVLVKGGDYNEGTIVGAPDVRSWGGDVRVIPLPSASVVRPTSFDPSHCSAMQHRTPRARASYRSGIRECCAPHPSRMVCPVGAVVVAKAG
jgi:D-beta-D-heptose 7-phosphate kinase/D-beta-D-heptose 1-phosphate adenosyltransferase